MVLSFFRRRDDDGLDQVARTVTGMLADARHSFDLAMGALVAGADPRVVDAEVRSTDERIGDAEQEVRRRLLVHAVTQGTGDVEIVLGYLMLSRKIERIGDQAKNILDLALEGVDLSDDPDVEVLRAHWTELSSAFAGALEFLDGSRSDDQYAGYRARGDDHYHRLETELRQLIHSDLPGTRAVPRALLARYLKRIAANLTGIVSSLVDPFDQIEVERHSRNG
jgi:phosphate uptake regulator